MNYIKHFLYEVREKMVDILAQIWFGSIQTGEVPW